MSDLPTHESFRSSTVHEASSDFRPAHAGVAACDGMAVVSVFLGVASPALRCGLESLIAVTPGMRLAGSAQSTPELLDHLAHARADVALLDPFLGGHANVRALLDPVRTAAPAIHCVLITDEHQPRLVHEAVKAGATGFVGASAHAQEIRTALLEASRGRRYIAPAIAARLAESLTLEELTSREMDVLTLLARGDCNKTIARGLGVTVGTVKTHVRSILCKLDARSRTEAALKACRFGLVGLHH